MVYPFPPVCRDMSHYLRKLFSATHGKESNTLTQQSCFGKEGVDIYFYNI